ncbi:hypothetical protein EJV47_04005 [Hymenobacter gummosus]|uniref:Addiction module protein n=1 Tax=Hymenobacter gummosus TaxID=1776032 RepID=A0A3S0JCF6_9BACT|nr:hypothetical protein [Hymenobacter gummosus]RTQ52199.1 hypothetical protein EJV47_04005 [Hymenobacter gummosus]
MTKDKVLETVNALPAEFELEELIERLIFIEKVEAGAAALDRGDAVSHEDVKKLVQSWRK